MTDRREFIKRALGSIALITVAKGIEGEAAAEVPEDVAQEGYVTVLWDFYGQPHEERIHVNRCSEDDTFYCEHVLAHVRDVMNTKRMGREILGERYDTWT